MSPKADRDSTVLPQPDSPTTARVRPRARRRLTPSTATAGPRAVSKTVVRSSMASKVSSCMAGVFRLPVPTGFAVAGQAGSAGAALASPLAARYIAKTGQPVFSRRTEQ